jgi:tight adherence protein B
MPWFWWKIVAAAGLACSTAVIGYAIVSRHRLPYAEQVARYVTFLDGEHAHCFSTGSGRMTAKRQAMLLALVGLLAVLAGEPWLLLASFPVAVAPALHLASLRRKRRAECDAQAGAFCLTLANLLRTIPNIQSALEASVLASKAPLADEIRLALAEVSLGSPLDLALLNCSARVKSKGLDAGISALLVGYQVGGNLPKLLETTSATLREMDRLDGVVQSKTAEGRAQLGVLAILPGAIVFAFNLASPGYFAPLQDEWVGRLVLAGAATLWLSALFLAKAILMVDI